MSLRAMLWALEEPRADELPARAFRVLMLLAEAADNAGHGAGLGAGHMAARLRVTRRTVERHMAALADLGMITEGDQDKVAYLPVHIRPKVWDLDMPSGRTPDRTVGGTPDRKRVYPPTENASTPRQLLSPEPSTYPRTNNRAGEAPRPSLPADCCRSCRQQHPPDVPCSELVSRPDTFRDLVMAARIDHPPTDLSGGPRAGPQDAAPDRAQVDVSGPELSTNRGRTPAAPVGAS